MAFLQHDLLFTLGVVPSILRATVIRGRYHQLIVHDVCRNPKLDNTVPQWRTNCRPVVMIFFVDQLRITRRSVRWVSARQSIAAGSLERSTIAAPSCSASRQTESSTGACSACDGVHLRPAGQSEPFTSISDAALSRGSRFGVSIERACIITSVIRTSGTAPCWSFR